MAHATDEAGGGEQFLTTRQVSDLLAIPYWTLLDRARRGLIPRGVVLRVGKAVRWHRERLHAWLAEGGDLPGRAPTDPIPARPRGRGRSSDRATA